MVERWSGEVVVFTAGFDLEPIGRNSFLPSTLPAEFAPLLRADAGGAIQFFDTDVISLKLNIDTLRRL